MSPAPVARSRTRVRRRQVPILRGADLTTRSVALVEAWSEAPGPTVWLTAGLHGDEVGGCVVVHEIFDRVSRRGLLAGRLAAFPLLNPFGFEATSRHIPATGEDLNRSFPGDPDGTIGQRIAHLVHARILADVPALVLDLHNDWIRSIPYALIDPRPASEAGRHAHAAARRAGFAMGLPVVDEQEEGMSRAALRATLSGSLLERGVPAVTLELGAAGIVVERNVRIGVAAVWRALAELGLVEPDDEALGASGDAIPSDYHGRLLQYSHHPLPRRSGIARFHVEPGRVVRAGMRLATISDVFGRRLERVEAETDALVLGHADSSLSMPGVALFAMARVPERRPKRPVQPAGSGIDPMPGCTT